MKEVCPDILQRTMIIAGWLMPYTLKVRQRGKGMTEKIDISKDTFAERGRGSVSLIDVGTTVCYP